jgi:hypothetical protein
MKMAKKDTQQQPTQPPKNTALAVPKSFAVTNDVPDYIDQSVQKGTNFDIADMIIPRLEIVQALSPARQRNDPNFIKGAEEGMMYNNVTRELYGESVYVVPLIFRKEYLVWVDRKKKPEISQGFRGAFHTLAEANEKIKALPEEAAFLEAVETGQHFCLLLNSNTQKIEDIVMSMAKSKAKVSRNWNSLKKLSGGSSFSRVYHITTVQEKNAANQPYFNFRIAVAGYPPKPIYDLADKKYEEMMRVGDKLVASREVDSTSTSPGDDAEY